MQIVAICEITGWTYEQYCNTPDWFLSLFIKKLEIDNKKNQQELAKMKNKTGTM